MTGYLSIAPIFQSNSHCDNCSFQLSINTTLRSLKADMKPGAYFISPLLLVAQLKIN